MSQAFKLWNSEKALEKTHKKFFSKIFKNIWSQKITSLKLLFSSHLKKIPIKLFTCAYNFLFFLFDHSIQEHLPHRKYKNYFSSPNPFSLRPLLILVFLTFISPIVFSFSSNSFSIFFSCHKNISPDPQSVCVDGISQCAPLPKLSHS